MIKGKGGENMERKGLTQEGLKLVACVTMLLDHLAVVEVMGPIYRTHSGMRMEIYELLRLIGRIAFPIYCFLLAEGSVRTRNPRRYGIRLAISAVISELPYDIALWGGITWQHQNVMVTLFLGFCTLEGMKRCGNLPMKLLTAAPFVILAELVGSDYGADGILLITLFALTRDIPHGWILQLLGMWFIFSPGHAMFLNWLGGVSITTQEWAALALIPICCYNGQKSTRSKTIRWAFYLFYPAHLMALYFIGRL